MRCFQVSCTAFNEDSSRSHIICRLSIEACDRVADEELRSGAARTLSYLNLIDLAGSESAKVMIGLVKALTPPTQDVINGSLACML